MALYAFDGTWQDADKETDSERSNVYRFHARYSAIDGQESFYWPGIGSRFGLIGKYIGGAFGIGASWRLAQALQQVYRQFEAGDDVIDTVGFSRGAATAVAFTLALGTLGVRAPKKSTPFTVGLMKYRGGEVVHPSPRIRFLGLFDTVFTTEDMNEVMSFKQILASYGGERLLKVDFDLPPIVDGAFHAMAIHERTPGFEVTRFQNACEVWFPGVHGDIGRGTTSMQWMADRANSQGVRLGPEDADLATHPPVPNAVTDRTYLRRKIQPGDSIHASAADLPLGVDIASLSIKND